VDAATYQSQLETLQSFASQAATEIVYAPITGSARYAVVRQHTGDVFNELNSAFGTHFTLPATNA
jgi:hypothetical protein